MNPIPYGKQEITEEDIKAVTEALKGEFLTQGPLVQAFEKAFAEYIGAPYAVAVSNGTAALHIGALALGSEGKKVITTPLTFAASANCVLYCGGTIDFVDIDPETGLMDLNLLREKLQNSPKGTYAGVIPVHYAGNILDMRKLRSIAEEFNLWILEDACHAPGGEIQNDSGTYEKVGNGKYANVTAFSFHPVKHLTSAEGGIVTTSSKELYEKMSRLRTHGITRDPKLMIENHGGWYYEMQELGYNYRLTDLQCALGVSQLSRASENLLRRRQIAKRYDDAFRESAIRIPKTTDETNHAYHLFPILVNERKAFYDFLKEKNVFTQVHYVPVHLHPYYQNLGWNKGDFPHTEKWYSECLSLPMFHSLKDTDQDYVISMVKEFFKVHS